jgi:hypothetical protein
MFYKNYLITITIILFSIIHSFSQKQDLIWLAGGNYNPQRMDSTLETFVFDFNFDPLKIYVNSVHEINMAGANATLCDTSGQLIAYTNGQIILNGDNSYIEDTINFSKDIPPQCNDWLSNYDESQKLTLGLLGNQRILLLPIGNKFYAIYNSLNRCPFIIYKISYSEIIINASFPKGKISKKDIKIYNDTMISSIQAVRHGNGKDWWVVGFTPGNEYLLLFLADEKGIHFVNKYATGEPYIKGTGGQICFSPDGKHIAYYTAKKLNDVTGGGFGVASFDRCDGSISNIKSKILPQYGLGSGVAFSNDSHYLYVSHDEQIRQYDLQASNFLQSERLAAQYDGFFYNFPGDTVNTPINYLVNFCYLKLGPDGRIYIFPSSAGQRYMSVMDHPTRSYQEVGVRQHSIFTPRVFTRTLPNLPEFRLGPLDGSACDTLGIDNHPIAKFKYDPDSLDHLYVGFTDLSYFRPVTWSWDFGDGSALSSIRHPWHTYSKNGTYKVCLTVSNENSSNTTCRTLTLGTSSTTEDIGSKADIHLFPNPVTDLLLITIGDYIPEHGQANLFDIKGQMVHKQRVFYGHNTLDMTHLPAGTYICRILDGQHLIRDMKVVKVE